MITRNWQLAEERQRKELKREFRKTYLKLMERIIWSIQMGDAQAAEDYQTLEETWQKIYGR